MPRPTNSERKRFINKDGMALSLNNRTPLGPSKIRLVCQVCFKDFVKYACWVKRQKNSYCGKACADQARIVEIKKACFVCEKIFVTTPTGWFNYLTCSRKCLRELRRSRFHGIKKVFWPFCKKKPRGYTASDEEISRLGEFTLHLIKPTLDTAAAS